MKYRAKIIIEEIGRGHVTPIGTRYVNIDEYVGQMLRPLPDDREIYEIMADKSWYAFAEREKVQKQIKDRQDAIDHLSHIIRTQVEYIIKKQDKINGYEQ